MTFLALPPELLLVILWLVSDSPLEGQRSERLASLCSVHSSWRTVAQSLLPREIIILPGFVDKIVGALDRAPFENIKTRKLRLVGSIDELLNGRGRKRWLELETLDYAGPPSSSPRVGDLGRIFEFQNLRELRLTNARIRPGSFHSTLPSLSRLVLGRNLYFDHNNPCEHIFSRSAFPSLRHLSLLEFRPTLPLDRLLSPLLPFLTTLAIYEPHHSSFARVLAKLENCQHLAIHCRTDDLLQLLHSQLPGAEDGRHPILSLKSLHLEASDSDSMRDDLENWVANGAQDGHGSGIKAERITLYGSRHSESKDQLVLRNHQNFFTTNMSSDSAAHHHQPYKTETVSSTDSAPTSTVTPETSSTSAPAQSTVQPSTAETTSAAASTEKATPAASTEGEKEVPKAEGSTVADGASSAQTEYPEQSHAGKVGLGPNYKDGSGFADQVKAKGEILKGKLTHKPELVEQGHLRESGALAAQARKEEINDDSDSPFARPDDGEADKKPENPKAEDVKETGHEARNAAATSGTKST